MDAREVAEAGEALMRWVEDWSGESGETTDASQEDIEAIWFGGWATGREAQADEARFHSDQAVAAQRRMEGLEAEVRRLRDLLGTYGHHVASCPAFDPPPGLPGFACACGWGELAPDFDRV